MGRGDNRKLALYHNVMFFLRYVSPVSKNMAY